MKVTIPFINYLLSVCYFDMTLTDRHLSHQTPCYQLLIYNLDTEAYLSAP